MTKAEEIVSRVVKAFGERDCNLEKNPNGSFGSEMINGKKISVDEVYRHNGTIENASARVMVITFRDIYNPYLYEAKIPYNASDKRIANCISNALEKYL